MVHNQVTIWRRHFHVLPLCSENGSQSSYHMKTSFSCLTSVLWEWFTIKSPYEDVIFISYLCALCSQSSYPRKTSFADLTYVLWEWFTIKLPYEDVIFMSHLCALRMVHNQVIIWRRHFHVLPLCSENGSQSSHPMKTSFSYLTSVLWQFVYNDPARS